MSTEYKKLNIGWNADPNVPDPTVEIEGCAIRLTFLANAYEFAEYKEGDLLQLVFQGCSKYRLGSTNDEGWYMGQCRFGQKIPWGEFYELSGDLLLDAVDDWEYITTSPVSPTHFLFYLRDNMFECSAEKWEITRI